MKPEERDLAYLWNMRKAAREIVSFVRNVPFTRFEKNNILRYAVERQLLVVGEAANHVSEEFRDNIPKFPGHRLSVSATCWRMNMGRS